MERKEEYSYRKALSIVENFMAKFSLLYLRNVEFKHAQTLKGSRLIGGDK